MPQYAAICRRFAVLCALGLGLGGAAVGPAAAQAPTAIPAGLERSAAVNSERRTELQRELRRHAEVLDAQSAVVRIVAKLVGPAVVHIEADVPPQPGLQVGRGKQIEEAGSGVIIEWKDAFYVLTNRHVIRDAKPAAIRISLVDGRSIHPTKVFDDAATDVAVLAVSQPGLVAASIGDSSRMDVGDFVLAVGSPFDLRHSVTFGIISAKGRRDLTFGENNSNNTGHSWQDFLQTDAAINVGNSGGPLVNLRGEVIGINTAIASNSGGNVGIGFAIPTNLFMLRARQLIEPADSPHPYLGVSLDSHFGPAMAKELGLPQPSGAHVSLVSPGSPAEAANLRVGDVILAFDDTPVEDDFHLMHLVSQTEVGAKVPLLVFRDRQPVTVTVEIGDSTKPAK